MNELFWSMMGALLKGYTDAFKRKTEDLLSAPDVLKQLASRKGSLLQFMTEEARKDHDVVLTAVKRDGMALRYASPDLQDDFEIVFNAVENNGVALQ